MPELPEVETTLRGIEPHIDKQIITQVIIRHPHLRWPIPKGIQKKLVGHRITRLYRRGKYLLFDINQGTLLLHLGMSGKLRVLSGTNPAEKHDHVDIVFANKKTLRFTDPRRFGALLWTEEAAADHPLLADLGPEPLTAAFSSHYLWQLAQGKTAPVKSFIMNSKVVVGVGNIYATEALYAAKIHPKMPAGSVNQSQYQQLVRAIKTILKKAIRKGGTTLKDFTKSDGSPGYFSLELKAYGREGEPCERCHQPLKSMRLLQRSTVYCPHCQKL